MPADDLVMKYSRAISNVAKLRRLGATVLHGADATVMARDHRLAMQKLDRVVFNFPVQDLTDTRPIGFSSTELL